MELVRKYTKGIPLYSNTKKWTYTVKEGSWEPIYIPKPQELVKKYNAIQYNRKYPVWA